MMTHGDMPLGWGWLAKHYNKESRYLVVKVAKELYLYPNRDYEVKEHLVHDTDTLPDTRYNPYFFLPIGVI